MTKQQALARARSLWGVTGVTISREKRNQPMHDWTAVAVIIF